MNYIKRLENENRVLGAELVALKTGLGDLRSYLESQKFYEETTVQVRDVLHRIEEIFSFSKDLAHAQMKLNEKGEK